MREEVFISVQDLPVPRSEVFPFFADPANLEALTPPASADFPQGGTRMTDLVRYRVGWGIIGHIVTVLWVRKDIAKIFDYRQQVLAERFRPAAVPQTAP